MSREVVLPTHFVRLREGARAGTKRPIFSVRKAINSSGLRRFAHWIGVRFAICAKDNGQGRRAVAAPKGLRLRKTKGDPFPDDLIRRTLIRPVLVTEA